ncbi:MAG: hypothetical protein OXF01_15170 [Gemmatimonadetes bacterium]|nr:hypothetical protein [Gemmatimonadota bacterium]
MPPDDPSRGDPPRHYSDTEVSRLLKYATELQQADEAGGRGGHEGGGMTLATLQEVAAEAGIEPRHVQLAAARIDGPAEPTGRGHVLAGTPLLVRAERVIPGELREEDYEQIVTEIQMATYVQGNALMVGRTLTWRSVASEHQFRRLQVTVESRNGETRIQAEERLHGYAGMLYGGVVGCGGTFCGTFVGLTVGLGGLGSALFAAAFPVTLIGGLYVAMRQVMKSTGRKRRAQLEGLVERIARYAAAPQPALKGSERPALPG